MATHPGIPAWRISWTGEPGGLHTVHGVAKIQTRLKRLSTHAQNKYMCTYIEALNASLPVKCIFFFYQFPQIDPFLKNLYRSIVGFQSCLNFRSQQGDSANSSLAQACPTL